MNLRVTRFLFLLPLFSLNPAATGAAEADLPAAMAAARSIELIIAPGTLRSDEVTLAWDKPADVGTTATFQVLRDGRVIGTTSKIHFTAKGLEPAHSYVFAVKVQGASGGASRSSNVLQIRTAPEEHVVSVEQFGARGDGVTMNTKAIQAAIDACPPNGVVLIPRGVFLSGALFLKSDMTLLVAEGSVLKGSSSPSDYEPFFLNRFEGWELRTYASLLNAGRMDHAGPPNVRNLSIRGPGRISGGGAVLAKAMIQAGGDRSRGRLFCLMNCASVEIQGLILEESPSWTLHYIYCEDLSCHDLTINSSVRNGDGIDPDSSRNSYIFNCSFSNDDDCIAIKSGKNPEGNVINRPTENVRIFDCAFIKGHGISIGSEMSGGVRNVLVQDCIAGDLLNGLQIKGTKDRGNVVEGVVVRDCELRKISILTVLAYNNDGQPAPGQPFFRDFRFVNIDLTKARPASPVVIVNGFSQEGHRTRNVSFENLRLPDGAIIRVDQAEDVTFSKVTTTGGGKPVFEISRSERVAY